MLITAILHIPRRKSNKMKFEELGVKTEIVKALNEMGIIEPTQIQEKSIPVIKAGKDLIGMSKTGSGKTAAFGAPILEKIMPGKGLQVLIMGPTRELAIQISQEMQKFGKYLQFRTATVYGGVAIGPQMRQIEQADIVVGTPGRLLDHLQRGTINLSKISCLVLDEADKMVEMGFIEDITRIISQTPRDRQMLLFGATISSEVDYLKQKYMHNPEIAKAEAQVEEEFLKQYYYNVMPNEKFSLLVHLLKKEQIGQAIIFCSTRSTVEIVEKNLRANGIKAEMTHGKLSQNRRQRVLENFNKGNPNILVASAVAARGLDIKDVTHIFNFDLSHDPQEYIHRIGRTARAGESGKAITLLSQKDHDAFNNILRGHNLNVELLPKEDFPSVPFRARSAPQYSRFGGRFDRSRNSFGRRRSSYGAA